MNEIAIIFKMLSGSVSIPYQLTSSQPISERTIDDIDQKSIAMIENGFHEFYKDFAEFLFKLKIRKNSNDDDIRSLILFECREDLLMFLFILCVSILVFVLDVIVFHFNRWYRQRRNRRIAAIR